MTWNQDGASQQFITHEDEAQFGAAANRLAMPAAEKVRRIRSELPDLAGCVNRLTSLDEPGFHQCFHAAVALGLLGRRSEAEAWFDRVTEVQDDRAWAVAIKSCAGELRELLGSPNLFRARVLEAVRASRSALRLDPDVPIKLS